jgi:pyrimidine operon attenuation protein / uracil phosphoribosyltransferase
MSAKVLLSSTDISRALVRVAHEILERNHGAENVVLVGIRTRGLPLAERLKNIIDAFEHRSVLVGGLDVLAYRDDVGYVSSHSHTGHVRNTRVRVPAAVGSRSGGQAVAGPVSDSYPVTPPNRLPFSIADRNVVLVDDVLYTGRTIRAAMDALVDLGRPRSIQLAVLVDRGHRELPIRPDYVGKNIPSARNELVRVRLVETDDEDAVTIVERDSDEGRGQ